MNKPKSIDEYISSFPESTQAKLEQMRSIIQEAAPAAEETISYQMPAFRQNGILVYFAACKHHIGFYPTGKGIKAFQSELTPWKWSKGAIQFPLDQPLPVELITSIVQFRVRDNMDK